MYTRIKRLLHEGYRWARLTWWPWAKAEKQWATKYYPNTAAGAFAFLEDVSSHYTMWIADQSQVSLGENQMWFVITSWPERDSRTIAHGRVLVKFAGIVYDGLLQDLNEYYIVRTDV